MVTIEFWSDYACPFCYIGKRRLEEALQLYGGEVNIVLKSFQLHPEATRLEGVPYAKIISKKYGISEAKAQASIDAMTAMAKEAGLAYNMDRLIHNNTMLAHRLTKYAATLGKAEAMEERLLKGYYLDFLDIGDIDTLASLAEEVGLNSADVKELLLGTAFTEDVLADQEEAYAKGIHGVPHFFIGQASISGAQPTSVFLKALQQI